MKKIGLFLLLTLIANPAWAGKSVTVTTLKQNKIALENLSLTNTVDVTTDTLRVNGNVGFVGLYVDEDKSGGAGDVDIYAQYSYDNSNWSRAYSSDMAGTITIDGNIVTALGNTGGDRLILFTPRISPYIRFIFSPDADSEITARFIYQEEY